MTASFKLGKEIIHRLVSTVILNMVDSPRIIRRQGEGKNPGRDFSAAFYFAVEAIV